jgi:hypothetical protein
VQPLYDREPEMLEQVRVVGRIVGLEERRADVEPVGLQAERRVVVGIERPLHHGDTGGAALGEHRLDQPPGGLAVVHALEEAEQRPRPAVPRTVPPVHDQAHARHRPLAAVAHQQPQRRRAEVGIAARVQRAAHVGVERRHPARVVAVHDEREPLEVAPAAAVAHELDTVGHSPSCLVTRSTT